MQGAPMHGVAQTILEQLGGKRFLLMTGAREMVGDDRSLSFRLPQGFAQNDIVRVQIELTPADLYNVTFWDHKGRIVRALTEMYWDGLQEAFTRATGLYTRL